MKKRIKQLTREAFIRYAYIRRLPKVPYPPSFIAIEPTNYCNYRCLMCPQSSKTADVVPRGFMSDKVFEKVIEEVKHYVFEIFIQLGGEPLLHPKLPEFIRKAGNEGLITGISTNASLLDRELSGTIIKSRLDKLVITFTDGGNERYEKNWRGGDYDKVRQNIETFLELKKGLKRPKVIMQIIKFYGEDKGLDLNKNFADTWRRLGIDAFSPIWATYWAGNFKGEAAARYKEAPRDSYYRPCGGIWRSLVVHWNGDVSPCCNDLAGEYIVGNVEKKSVREIWNSPGMVKLREVLSKGGYEKLKLCRNCLALWGRLPSEKKKWWGGLENRIKKIA